MPQLLVTENNVIVANNMIANHSQAGKMATV